MSFGQHTFRRILVARAAGRVDVVIAGVPAVARRIDPADQPEQPLLRAGQRDAPHPSGSYSGPRETVSLNEPSGRLMVSPSDR